MTQFTLRAILTIALSFAGVQCHPSNNFRGATPAGHPHLHPHPTLVPYGCGVKPPPETLLTTLKTLAVKEKNETLHHLGVRQSQTITVPTYFHVVMKTAAGAVPKATLDKQYVAPDP